LGFDVSLTNIGSFYASIKTRKNFESLEENTNIYDLGVGICFLDMTPKPLARKFKNRKKIRHHQN
jgi:hypothetical protein